MISTFSSVSLTDLDNNGFVLVSPACHISLIDKAVTELSASFFSKQAIEVNNDDIVMKTLNGANLLDSCPSVNLIYSHVLTELRSAFPQIRELEDATIGVSSNFLSGKNDRFRMHFDRNQLTVVVYLNDTNTFPLVIYPNIRRDPIATGIKDRFDIKTAKLETIFPRKNLAVVFYGRRTFHGVINAVTDTGINDHRYSLQFAFDFDDYDYTDQRYYGRAT